MRKSGGLLVPLTLIVAYYGFWVGAIALLLAFFPLLHEFFPIGGIGDLVTPAGDIFEIVHSGDEGTVFAPYGPARLAFASVGAIILTVPISWVYFITSRSRRIEQSFLQTIMILPVVVSGIAMIVQDSVALAFSLAGIVAAVRFRFTLEQPSDAMYIFVAIGIGLGSGIGALGVAAVISMAFVLSTLIIWRLDYGKSPSGPFLRLLTRRDADEDDY
ncbi:MAG: DUF4956 domain-containing protein [Proteobacteria bacterium]|nr:DUF4956 domain-containing protein [Pseudomonadota bacterium]